MSRDLLNTPRNINNSIQQVFVYVYAPLSRVVELSSKELVIATYA